jgi:hypothetical protein
MISRFKNESIFRSCKKTFYMIKNLYLQKIGRLTT